MLLTVLLSFYFFVYWFLIASVRSSVAIFVLVLTLQACNKIEFPNYSNCNNSYLSRPFGYVKLGEINKLNKRPYTIFKEHALLLKFEPKVGFSLMSLLSSNGLYPLVMVQLGDNTGFRDPYNGELFNLMGETITPSVCPNKKNFLPHYQLLIDEDPHQSDNPIIYGVVGLAKDKNYRLSYWAWK